MQTMMTQPKFRGSSHHFMFFVSIIASTFLVLKSTNSTELVATIVYSIGLLSMFGFSALYHRKKTTLEIKQRLRKLDHTGIFLMIAGTFTPICLLSLPLESGLKLLTIIWSVAAVGILQSIFFSRIHRLLRGLHGKIVLRGVLPSNQCLGVVPQVPLDRIRFPTKCAHRFH